VCVEQHRVEPKAIKVKTDVTVRLDMAAREPGSMAPMNEYHAHPAKGRILYCSSSRTPCGYSNALASSGGRVQHRIDDARAAQRLCLVRLIAFTACFARTPRPSSVSGASQEGVA
jgi:hypothetical protein